jgi:DNA-binding transcriptional ArsR family regulator
VAEREEAIDSVFKAISAPTRRHILELLRKGEVSAGDIAGAFPISGPSISRHLTVLKAARLISERRQANRILYALQPGRLTAAVLPWLRAVCPDEGAALEAPGAARRKKKEKPAQKATSKQKRRDGDGGVQMNGASGGHSRPATEVVRPVTQANS